MHKERTFKDKLTLFFKGLLMGAANKVPRNPRKIVGRTRKRICYKLKTISIH